LALGSHFTQGSLRSSGTSRLTARSMVQTDNTHVRMGGASLTAALCKTPTLPHPDASSKARKRSNRSRFGSSAAVTINNQHGRHGRILSLRGRLQFRRCRFTVTGAGRLHSPATHNRQRHGTGNQTIGNHSTNLQPPFCGSCAMSSVSSCTISFQHSWTASQLAACPPVSPRGPRLLHLATNVSPSTRPARDRHVLRNLCWQPN